MKAEKRKEMLAPSNDNVDCKVNQENSMSYDLQETAAAEFEEEQKLSVTRYRVSARPRPQRPVVKVAEGSEQVLRREQIARLMSLRGRRPTMTCDRGIVAFLADLWFLGQ